MHKSWSKGLTKENHPSIKKISETMKSRKIDNFLIWREKMRKVGKIKTTYLALKKDGDLAELIGVTLGDGHICIYPRTEELRITSNANNPGFINRYAKIIEKLFKKKAYIINSQQSKSTKIGIYEKFISKRMGISSGARGKLDIKVPDWILNNKDYIVRYLRGLYEAEGCLCVHKPTYTYKFLFANRNVSMLDNVERLLKKLGFHPHRSKCQIQISKKDEVFLARDVLGFRKY
jgi:hypothetical protein